MEIRKAYTVFYDIILKNFEKLKKARGETKGMIYWPPLIFSSVIGRLLPTAQSHLETSEWNRVQGPPSIEQFCHRLRKWMERILRQTTVCTVLLGEQAQTEQSESSVLEEGSRGGRVTSPENLFILQKDSYVSLSINHGVSSFHSGPMGGDFSKKSSLGYFLTVCSSSSYFVSSDLKLNVYGGIFTFLVRGKWNAAQSRVCGLGGGGRARPLSLAGILFPPEITNSTWERPSDEQLQYLPGKSLKS
eukprot:bmy_03980T0